MAKPAAAPTATTAKINNQHDYMSLMVKFVDGSKLRLNHSRNGMSGSVTPAPGASYDAAEASFKVVFKAAYAYMHKQGSGRTYGVSFDNLRDAALASANLAEFATKVPV